MNTFFPIARWLKHYSRSDFNGDLFAGVITAILLVPQGIAYAILAGLPPTLGLYASILPPVLYALFGTSRCLSVGPVSIGAIMVASAITTPEIIKLGNPVQSAIILSAETGLILLGMALLRLGGLVNFISHPVLTGFTSGAGLLIIASQLPQLFDYPKNPCGFALGCYSDYLQKYNPVTTSIGVLTLLMLLFFASPLTKLLEKTALSKSVITAISKCGPLLTVILATLSVEHLQLAENDHVAVVGELPDGFPALGITISNPEQWRLLFPYSGFIALIAYVESVAIAKVIANLRKEKIIPNQELIALAAANISSALSGGMPVAGGFSRTMVNYSAGARSQMAMLIAAALLAVAVVFISHWFENIPKATLAAIILVAITPLVKLRTILHTWRYDFGDGMAEALTLIGVLLFGIEEGIMLGIALTVFCYFRKASHPHIAIVGRVPNTPYYKNIQRHSVETWEHLLLLRIDENLTFANIDYIENFINQERKNRPDLKHIILILTSVSIIDSTALKALENLNHSLQAANITLHLSEIKGPVLDKLKHSYFIEQLTPGQIYLYTDDAVNKLSY